MNKLIQYTSETLDLCPTVKEISSISKDLITDILSTDGIGNKIKKFFDNSDKIKKIISDIPKASNEIQSQIKKLKEIKNNETENTEYGEVCQNEAGNDNSIRRDDSDNSCNGMEKSQEVTK